MSKTKVDGIDLLDQVWDFVKTQAEGAGIELIQLISDRAGWGRRLAKYGFKPCEFRAYHREIK